MHYLNRSEGLRKAQMTVKIDVDKDWHEFVKKQKECDLETIIDEKKLKSGEAKKYIYNAFRDGSIITTEQTLTKFCHQF